MTGITLDHSFYAIFARAGGEDISLERALYDMASLPQTVLDMLKGQFDAVHYVIEFNPAEGWSRNVTEVVADNLAHLVNAEFHDGGRRPRRELHTFVEKHSAIRIPAPAEHTFAAA